MSGDDSNRFAQINQLIVCKSPAVALATHGTIGFTGERRTNPQRRDAGSFKAFRERWVDFGVALNDDLTVSSKHLISGQSSDQTITKTTVLCLHHDRAHGAAVVLSNDHVLGDVNQTAGEVAGVSRAQRRVHQALTGAIGRDHVLRDRESFSEIGADRKVDDLPLRVRHQTAHAHQLTDLGHIAPSPRVGHHPNRVERIVVVEVLFDSINQTLVGLSPRIDHLGVTLNLCDDTKPV